MPKILQHILLWIGVYIVYTYMVAYRNDDLYMIAQFNIVNVSMFMAAYYLLKYVQIPYLYKKGKTVAFGISLALSALAFAAFCRMNGILWMDEMAGRGDEDIPFLTLGAYIVKTVRYYTPAIAILGWQTHQEQRKALERLQQLENEKVNTELKFLKAQINPHFLFNTLNNLYSYVVTQSPKAPDMIMRLSGILDYVLYRSQRKYVPLSEEVQVIENFIELEQIRYGERLRVEFNVQGDLSLPVTPLLLLSTVENAFKHGASGDIDEPEIRIDITTPDDTIYCNVWNTKSQHQGELNDAYKDGIGLGNIKRQLNLVYPDSHELKIDDRPRDFNVSIILTPAKVTNRTELKVGVFQ
ncbi:MAG: sensor histidine kinase [Saprospiraceae bacterium]